VTTAGGSARTWHAWSVWKTKVLLGSYLPEFTRAGAGKANHRTFLDCFAGAARSVDIDGKTFVSSPQIALRAHPQFTHSVFFELPENASELDASLRSEFPGREFAVVPGDCNLKISEGLDWLRNQGTSRTGPQLGPLLAFLDPDALELDWRTIEVIAEWNGQRDPKDFSRRRKPELLVLFPTGPMRRTLPADRGTDEALEAQKLEVDRLFGNRGWRKIYQAQREGRIYGEAAWIHYVEQYRLGLSQLGYDYVSAIEVRNTSNVVLYHLVFATSHDAGARIMKAVQRKARAVLPAMVEEEKYRRTHSGDQLFEESDTDLDRYAADPSKWARVFDDPPRQFDPSRFHPSETNEQMAMTLEFGGG
jgi:three-Cys-motif partner protein